MQAETCAASLAVMAGRGSDDGTQRSGLRDAFHAPTRERLNADDDVFPWLINGLRQRRFHEGGADDILLLQHVARFWETGLRVLHGTSLRFDGRLVRWGRSMAFYDTVAYAPPPTPTQVTHWHMMSGAAARQLWYCRSGSPRRVALAETRCGIWSRTSPCGFNGLGSRGAVVCAVHAFFVLGDRLKAGAGCGSLRGSDTYMGCRCCDAVGWA